MNKLKKEYLFFKQQEPNMRTLLVTNMLYALVLPIVEIFVGVFTNGHLVDGDTITMYYGASDEVICKAELSISEILNVLKQTQKK